MMTFITSLMTITIMITMMTTKTITIMMMIIHDKSREVTLKILEMIIILIKT